MKKYQYLIISIWLFLISCIVIIASILDLINKNEKEAIFNIIQSIVIILVLFIPKIISIKFKIIIGKNVEFTLGIFMIIAFLLGEIGRVYGKISWFDSIVHLASGFYIGSIYIGLCYLFLGKEALDKLIYHIGITTIIFVVGIGAIWELIEYGIDGIFKLNMQQFMSESDTKIKGIFLIGRSAIRDTIKDLFLDLLGGFLIAFIYTIALKKDNHFLKDSFIEIDKNE